MSTTRSEEPEPTSTRQSNSRFRPPIWGEDTRLVPAASTHTWLSALAGLLFVAGLSFLAGPVGMLAGIATTGVWYLLGSPYALAAGTVLAVAVVPTPADPLAVTLVGAPLLVLVLAPVVTTSHTGGFTAVVLATTGGLAAGGWLLAEWLPVWLVALALLGTSGLAAYTGHRFLLLQFGLVDGTDASTGTDSTMMTNHDS
ncbi:hypothetical protein [Halovenus salina]|uniref:hypothetical protein n=1 Tax=Halovenus salina TaxID=1510225 RepID=UPI002260B8D3|nr:hypothetical protein [Halovenus salina]